MPFLLYSNGGAFADVLQMSDYFTLVEPKLRLTANIETKTSYSFKDYSVALFRKYKLKLSITKLGFDTPSDIAQLTLDVLEPSPSCHRDLYQPRATNSKSPRVSHSLIYPL